MLKIFDFSAAVFGNVLTPHNHDIQPQPFCAPEVLLKAGWSYSADIWNLVTVVSRKIMLRRDVYSQLLLCSLGNFSLMRRYLTGYVNIEGKYSREVHVAQMIRLLGPPPSRFLDKLDPCIRDGLFSAQGMLYLVIVMAANANCWICVGSFKFPGLIPSEEFNFSNVTPFLHGEDKHLFIGFVRRMLQWEPESRSSAKELYNDPWLCYEP